MRHIQRGLTTTFIVIILLGSAVAIAAVYLLSFESQKQKLSQINSFEDCAKHYPVMESYPEQCTTPDGKHFTGELTEEEKQQQTPHLPSPEVDETLTWKTYRNPQYHYEVKYPENWTIEENQEFNYTLLYPSQESKEIWDDIEKSNPIKRPSIMIDISSDPFSLPGSPNQYSLYLIKPQLIEVNGKQGVYSLKLCAPDCGIEFEYPYENGNKKLLMILTSLGEENTAIFSKEYNINIQDIDQETFKKIIQTLRVLQ